MENNVIRTNKLYSSFLEEQCIAYSAEDFSLLLNSTYMPDGDKDNKISIRDMVLLYLAYFKYGTYESLHVFNHLDKAGKFLRYRCLNGLSKEGYVELIPLSNPIGKANKLLKLTAKGIEQLYNRGYLEAAKHAEEILKSGTPDKEKLRTHEYALSLFISSFIHSDVYTSVEYENTYRFSSTAKSSKRTLRPDAILRLFTDISHLPSNISPADLPSETSQNSSFGFDRLQNNYFCRTYYIEQDMGTETLNILEKKIANYYTHNLFDIDLLTPYTGIVFAFAKVYSENHEHLRACNIKRLYEFMKIKNLEGTFTLNSFLDMSPAECKEAKKILGEKYYSEIRGTAILLKQALVQLHIYGNVSNYDAFFTYPERPIRCDNRRISYRDYFSYKKGYSSAPTSRDTSYMDNTAFHVDPPACMLGKAEFKEDEMLNVDMSLEELGNYMDNMAEMNYGDVHNRCYRFSLNKAQYDFTRSRMLNLCHYFTGRMEYFSSGNGRIDKLHTIRYMLSGLSVYTTPSLLGVNSQDFLLPEKNGFIRDMQTSLSAYIATENGILHRSYTLGCIPITGYPSAHSIEHDCNFICLEELVDLPGVCPAYVYTFSFIPPAADGEAEDANSASSILASFYKMHGTGSEAADSVTADMLIPEEDYDDEEDWLALDEDKDIQGSGSDTAKETCTYLPPSVNRSPIPERISSRYKAGKNLYHVCIENISSEISGYIRLYFMCSYVKRDTDMLLIGIADTYTDAAEFASHFPDLYRQEQQNSFDFHGLQLMFMLKSDMGCERNALFRVGSNGSIYRVKDNL